MIRALIADDEPLSRRLLHQMLERHDDVVIVAECGDGVAARAAMAEHDPDVAFLDIRMPLESGLTVARARDASTGPLIVFVTAFGKFALPAFDAAAVDYLTKPLTEERFDAALDRVRERIRLRRDAKRYEALAPKDEAQPSFLPHLVSRVGTRDVIIRLESIDHIEADDVYAAIIERGQRHLVRMSLDALAHRLDPSQFARVHRSYIVRLDRVRQVRWRRGGGGEVVLASGVSLPVSRRRRAALEHLVKPHAGTG